MQSGLIRKIRNSISLRIAFLFCVTFAIGLAAAFVVTYLELSYSLEKSSREILAAKLQESKAVLTAEGLTGLRQFLSIEKNRILNAPYLVRVITAEGETLYIKPSIQEKTFNFDEIFNQKTSPEKYLGWQSLDAIDDEDTFNLLTERVDRDLYLQVGKSSEQRDEILEEILLNFGLIEVFLVVLSGFLGTWYSRKSLAPLRELLSTIRDVEKGDLSRRVPVAATNDELQVIGDTFNRMLGRIETLIRVMRESLDNVAHDIRTPLTRIRIVAENALMAENPELFRESLEDNAESAGKIAELVQHLLSISEAEAGVLKLHIENCAIEKMIHEVVDIYEFPAQDKNIQIDASSVPPDLHWFLDSKRMKQVIGNLIDNAIKFSPERSCITISAKQEDGFLRIDVRDQGFGISEADRTQIWNRLYRGDKSRSSQGLGLGLAIVRSIVLAHGGHCEAVPLEVGTQFSILIPKI